MIRTLDQLPSGVLGFEAVGKLSATDYTDILAPALAEATENHGKLRIVMVVDDQFGGLEAGALWQDLKMGIKDWTAWERIALVTDHAWMRDGLKMFAWAMPGDARDFDLSQREEAIAWAAG